MPTSDRLAEKLKRIEALFARPGCEGEKMAAEQARQQVLDRLAELEQRDPPIEYTFKLPDLWSRRLFLALLRRYGITPYRKRGQTSTAVKAQLTAAFVDETLWPEYLELQRTLREYFDEFTSEVIVDVLKADERETEEWEPTAGLGA